MFDNNSAQPNARARLLLERAAYRLVTSDAQVVDALLQEPVELPRGKGEPHEGLPLDRVVRALEVAQERRSQLAEHTHLVDPTPVLGLGVVDTVGGIQMPVGLLTDRDLVVEVMGAGIDPESVTARVREHPGQWLWMHRRWRRQPEGA